MTIHYIEPSEDTLHGPFSKDRAAVMTIDSGDTVRFKTLDAGWGLEPFSEEGTRRQFEPRQQGHALCGPVAVRGAKPGMVLEVQINNLVPGAWGWTSAGGFGHPVNKWLGLADDEGLTLNWAIDNERMTATHPLGHQIALRPFMGVMGMPADVDGMQPTAPPRFCGGNIDCKELTAGSTLYLPIAVEGGLFSTGDGHGVQGDGEVSVTAIECPMDLVDLTLTVRSDLHFSMPRAKTAAGWITFGFHEDLNEASMIALSQMLDLMEELYGYTRKEALGLASLVVDLRITQIVNGAKGCHAILRHDAISGLRPRVD
jgi:acetamidase/formamidase